MDRYQRQTRSLFTKLNTRAEGADSQDLYIEGYFAVFGSETELWPGAYEEIAPGAFNGSLQNDIRSLINHETRLVLGRLKAGTLELKVDAKGLWGRVKINPEDADAMNLYARVKRGDVDQCSFGFDILSEETDYRDDGTVKWLLKEIDLHEVSVCTFPAYEATGVGIQERKAEYAQHHERQRQQRKQNLKARLNK